MEQIQVKKPRWSEADIERFKEIYPKASAAELKEAFPGRSANAMYQLASELHIRKQSQLHAKLAEIATA